MPSGDFQGWRVLALEARRAAEIAELIRRAGGEPQVAPAMREAPLETNPAGAAFAEGLQRGDFDWVVFLTATGVHSLVAASGGTMVAALRGVKVAARGAKVASALRTLGIPVAAVAPEPATWQELLAVLPEQLPGVRCAVQEYGAPNPELTAALTRRGAQVTAVPVYRWELPADLAPLRQAIRDLLGGRFAVVLFTNAVQVAHLFEVAAREQVEAAVAQALRRSVIASIGPSTSAELARRGCPADFEPSHPRMGVLVQEAAAAAAKLLDAKRPADRPE